MRRLPTTTDFEAIEGELLNVLAMFDDIRTTDIVASLRTDLESVADKLRDIIDDLYEGDQH